jgi:hypothetical protein
MQRWSRVMWLSVPCVAIHAAIVLPLGGRGPETVTWAHTASMLLVAALLVRATMGSRAWTAVGSALAGMAPAAAMASVFVVVRLALGRHPPLAVAIGGLVLATLAYLVLLVAFRPDVRSRLRWLVPQRLTR